METLNNILSSLSVFCLSFAFRSKLELNRSLASLRPGDCITSDFSAREASWESLNRALSGDALAVPPRGVVVDWPPPSESPSSHCSLSALHFLPRLCIMKGGFLSPPQFCCWSLSLSRLLLCKLGHRLDSGL